MAGHRDLRAPMVDEKIIVFGGWCNAHQTKLYLTSWYGRNNQRSPTSLESFQAYLKLYDTVSNSIRVDT